MPKQILFDNDSDEEVTLKVENEYAKKYDAWREKEEIHKLEQKYGPKALNSDASISSDSEDESDEPPEVSEETETQFLKTLALLKTKDPRIYDPNYKFFNEGTEKEIEKEAKPSKLTFADSDEDDDDGAIFSIEKKAEIAGDTQQPKEKSGTNKAGKEDKVSAYLKGKAAHIDDAAEQDLAPLKALWSDPAISEGEAFLRDYILNKKYLDEDEAAGAVEQVRDDADLEADEELIEEQGKFERAYNFRFEEPDEEYLKRFPRTMNYIRPKDDKRSRKRAEVRSRKEEEKQRKMEEIGRLKALKLKEIHDKIAKIKEVTGNDQLAFKDEDIEGDFDPAEHDRRMRAIFDEHYYDEADDRKPVFPDLDEELEIENWEKYEPEHEHAELNNDEPHCEDDDFNMDADYDPKKARENLLEEIQRTLGKKRRNRKKKSKLAELLASDKPKFVPTVADKTYSEYMEEYYKMDCEDIVGGDLPTRFKYREVVPNDFGLTIEEILLADDKELTQWVPLKKLVKHRPPAVEKSEVNTYAQKAADIALKKKVLPSLFKDLPEEPEIVVPIEEATKKKKKKKKNKQNKAKDEEIQNGDENIESNLTNERNSEIDNSQEDSSQVEIVNEAAKTKKKNKNRINGQIENEPKDPNNVDGQSENGTKTAKKFDGQSENGPKAANNVDGQIDNSEVTNKEKKRKKNKRKHTEENTSVKINGELPSNNQTKKHVNEFIVENIEGESSTPNKKSTKTQQSHVDNDRKRKLDTDSNQMSKKKRKNKEPAPKNMQSKKDFKMKFKQKDNKDQKPINPLTNLSDERLKAYGLNPKKYRGFLKYKKF